MRSIAQWRNLALSRKGYTFAVKSHIKRRIKNDKKTKLIYKNVAQTALLCKLTVAAGYS